MNNNEIIRNVRGLVLTADSETPYVTRELIVDAIDKEEVSNQLDKWRGSDRYTDEVAIRVLVNMFLLDAVELELKSRKE